MHTEGKLQACESNCTRSSASPPHTEVRSCGSRKPCQHKSSEIQTPSDQNLKRQYQVRRHPELHAEPRTSLWSHPSSNSSSWCRKYKFRRYQSSNPLSTRMTMPRNHRSHMRAHNIQRKRTTSVSLFRNVACNGRKRPGKEDLCMGSPSRHAKYHWEPPPTCNIRHACCLCAPISKLVGAKCGPLLQPRTDPLRRR